MKLDPRRNLAATAAGLLGVFLFTLPWLTDPSAPVGPGRLGLLLAALACLAAGVWPSRRVRFVLLAVAQPVLGIIGIIALEGIGIAILLTAVIAAYGLVIEYAREGRE